MVALFLPKNPSRKKPLNLLPGILITPYNSECHWREAFFELNPEGEEMAVEPTIEATSEATSEVSFIVNFDL